MMNDKPHTFRIERDSIEVTRGGLRDQPDPYRRFAPGPPRYYVDGVEVTAEQFQVLLRAADEGA